MNEVQKIALVIDTILRLSDAVERQKLVEIIGQPTHLQNAAVQQQVARITVNVCKQILGVAGMMYYLSPKYVVNELEQVTRVLQAAQAALDGETNEQTKTAFRPGGYC